MRSFVTWLAILALCAQCVHSALIPSVANGNWSNPATWGGTVPTADDAVQVRHSVALDILSVSVNSLEVIASKTLSVLAGNSISANSINLLGSISGGGAVLAGNLNLPASSSSLKLSGASSLLEIRGSSINNPLDRNLEAQTVRVVSQSLLSLNGALQTNRAFDLVIPSGILLSGGVAGARLGGRLSMSGSTLWVQSGAVTLTSAFISSANVLSAAGIDIVLQPSSGVAVNGEVQMLAGVGGSVRLASGKSMTINAGQSFRANTFVAGGAITGRNATVAIANSLTLMATGSIALSGGSSLLDLGGDVINDAQRAISADVVRLSGNSLRTVSGLLPSTATAILTVTGDMNLVAGAVPLRLGGRILLGGARLTVRGGSVDVAGTELSNGVLETTADNANIFIRIGGNTINVNGGSFTLRTAANGAVVIPSGKKLSVAADVALHVHSDLRIEAGGSLTSTNGVAHLWRSLSLLAANSAVTFSGGRSVVVLAGNVDNSAGAALAADIVRLVAPASGTGSRAVSGVLQTSTRGGVLEVAADQTLTVAAGSTVGVRLGGVLRLNTFTLRFDGTGVSDPLLAVLNLVGTTLSGSAGSALVANNADIVFVTSYSVAAGANVRLHAADRKVIVSTGRTLTVLTGAVANFSPLLSLNGGDLAGAGTARVQNIELLQVGTANGEVKMDTAAGVIEVTGDINNSLNLAFAARNVRLSTSFGRTINGLVQTNAAGLLTLACSTTLSATSSGVVFGGALVMNGQTLELEAPLTLTSASIQGSGVIRFAEGCSCAPLTLTLSPASTVVVTGNVIFQNLLVVLSTSKTLTVNSGNSLRVAGGKSVLTLLGKLAGNGRVVVHSCTIASSGRVSMTTGSVIEYTNPLVNNGTYPIAVTSMVVAGAPPRATACEDDACLESTLEDLRREVASLSGVLRAAHVVTGCSGPNCAGWNADFSSFGSCSA